MSNTLKYGAIGCLAAAVVFYTISGVIVASTKEDVDSTLSKEGTKLVEAMPDSLGDIQVSAVVMPSQNYEYNNNLMTATNSTSSLSSMYADGVEDDLLPLRFETTDFDQYFPHLHFQQEYVPEGHSKPFCLHLDWIKREQAALRDRYISVINMPYCNGAMSPKIRWDSTFPKTGLDF